MFSALGRMTATRPRGAVIAWLLLVIVAATGTFTGFGGRSLTERLHSDQMKVPGTESAEVFDLTQSGDDKGPSITLIVDGVTMSNPAQAQKAATLMAAERTQLKAINDIAEVTDAFSFPSANPAQPSPQAQAYLSAKKDGFAGVITLEPSLDPDREKAAQVAVEDRIAAFNDTLGREIPGASAHALSTRVIAASIMAQVEHDLIRGEALGLPVALLLMVLVFGGFIAAGLPLAGALASIMMGMFGLWLLTHAMTIDSFILNVISLIGLALSIDYGLLMVSRFREESHQRLAEAGFDHHEARLPDRAAQDQIVAATVRSTVSTAGRTVFFSALTIAVAVSALLVMKSPVLRSIGIGAVMVVLLAVLTSLTLVPALLSLCGRMLLKPSPLGKIPGFGAILRAFGDVSTDEGAFSRLARWVHRRPWLVMLAVLALLAAMAAPLATLSGRNNFEEYIPADSQASTTYHLVQDEYPLLATPMITVVADKAPAQAADVVAHLKGLADVSFVSPPLPVTGEPGRSVISLRMDVDDPVGKQVTQTVRDLRAWDPGYQVLVGGPAAGQLDFQQSLFDRAGLGMTIMVLAVFVLLFLMTGSLVVPLKALLINLLSLASSLGATWFVFDHGWFGLPQMRGLEIFVIAVAIAFGFGLAMDYEVFLLARIKEFYDAGDGNDLAVEHGLQRSGRIITSAAAIIIAVFFGFIAGDMVSIKQIGVALAIVVAVDATLVRMLLVPATMTVLGDWNWWAPKPLRAIYEKFKIVH